VAGAGEAGAEAGAPTDPPGPLADGLMSMPGIDAADDAVGPYVNAGAPAALVHAATRIATAAAPSMRPSRVDPRPSARVPPA
jgi:hypothetical protein